MPIFKSIAIICLFGVSLRSADFPELVLPQGVGVNVHFTRGHERDLDMIAAAGFKFVPMDFGWAGIERRKGEYDWSAYDELTANLERRGLRALYILDYSNPLYEETVTSRNPITGNEHFGAVTHDLQPKPAYIAVQTLTRELSGYRIEKRLLTGSTNDWILLLSNGAKRKLAAWTVAEPHVTTIDGFNFTSAEAVSGNGEPAETTLADGSISLTLRALPQYIL
jgi:hypothetical protein